MSKIIGILQSGPDDNNFVYARWVHKLGFAPIIIPYTKKGVKIIADGYIIPGGIDVSPIFYNSNNLSSVGFNLEFDKWQDSYIKFAVENSIPLFGICRGHQLIACHFGGELFQEIEKVHKQNSADFKVGRSQYSHFVVSCDQDSTTFPVNSMHHQSVKITEAINKEMTMTFRNGRIVEGLKHKIHKIESVQWHPEELKNWNTYVIDFFGGVNDKK